MHYQPDQITTLVPIGEVCQQTSLSKSCTYDLIKRGEFPKPRKLTKGRVAWVQAEVSAWIDSRHVASAKASTPANGNVVGNQLIATHANV
jgi:prophage regulatory protein